MAPKFQNVQPLPLFGSYTDPFEARRGTGPVFPPEPLPRAGITLPAELPQASFYSWLGHSSLLLRLGSKTIYLDPVFSRRTSPVPFAGPRRFPGTEVDPRSLPPADLILLTHSHYDHMDRASLRALDSPGVQYVVPRCAGRYLRRFGIPRSRIRELDWMESCTFGDLQIVLTPSQHDSGRSPLDFNRSLWGGYLLKDSKSLVFYSGDGGYSPHFREISSRFGAPDLAFLECGQYNTRWHAIHMFPEETAQAARDLGAKLAVPMHWGAYVLSDHPWDDPPRRFARRAEELEIPYRIPKLMELVPFGT